MQKQLLTIALLLFLFARTNATPTAGFFLPDSVHEMTVRYKTVDNLIVLPVRINGSIEVNLILDTGCRNMLLFGKHFNNMFQTLDKPIEFAGLGSGQGVKGKVSLNNRVTFGAIAGNGIPIIVVPERNLFARFKNIDGVIGYEIFIKFEIEINFRERLITFRPASESVPIAEFQYAPLKVVDSRPLIEGTIFNGADETNISDLLIDTGSSMGLIIGTNDRQHAGKRIAKGLNGPILGVNETINKIQIASVELKDVTASYIFDRDNYASIGMDILKHYRVILNYPKAYVGFCAG
jgi:hypothetical protein